MFLPILITKSFKEIVGSFTYAEHSNLFWGEVTWRGLVTWPWAAWIWNFHVRKWCLNKCAENGSAPVFFLDICERPQGVRPGPALVYLDAPWELLARLWACWCPQNDIFGCMDANVACSVHAIMTYFVFVQFYTIQHGWIWAARYFSGLLMFRLPAK